MEISKELSLTSELLWHSRYDDVEEHVRKHLDFVEAGF